MNELAKLSDFEDRAEQAVKDVNRGMERFAQELKQIKDLGLWKGGYDSFEHYCNTRWSRTVRTVQRALKAHTVRQKLLAVASSAEKPVVEAASTRRIEEVAKAPKDQQMAHLTIGRNKPTATKTADFYTSNPSKTEDPIKMSDPGFISGGGSFPASDPRNPIQPEDVKVWSSETQPMFNAETADRMATVRVLREYPLKDESHRPYLLQLAGCIERGEPA